MGAEQIRGLNFIITAHELGRKEIKRNTWIREQMSVNSSWEGNSTKWDTHINSENETLPCQFNPTNSNQATKKINAPAFI
jgi:hypothetical protein